MNLFYDYISNLKILKLLIKTKEHFKTKTKISLSVFKDKLSAILIYFTQESAMHEHLIKLGYFYMMMKYNGKFYLYIYGT